MSEWLDACPKCGRRTGHGHTLHVENPTKMGPDGVLRRCRFPRTRNLAELGTCVSCGRPVRQLLTSAGFRWRHLPIRRPLGYPGDRA